MKIVQENGKFYKVVETKEEIDVEALLEKQNDRNNTGEDNSGNYNSGYRNSGDYNSGNCNSGYRNSGYRNSGNCNSGYWNSGYWNSGDWNSGDWNSGNCNSGYCNSGYRNSGYRNSGNWNSGDWNSGDSNSGYCNTQTPLVTMFDKPTDKKFGEIVFPSFFYFDTNVWVFSDHMSQEEKKEHPEYETTGGYLKTVSYHEAWRISWNKASDEDRRKVLELPNFDNEKFKTISGIDVYKELNID